MTRSPIRRDHLDAYPFIWRAIMRTTCLILRVSIPCLTALGILACSTPDDTYLPALDSGISSDSVAQLLTTKCAIAGCHGDSGTAAEGLILSASVALQNTVNVPSSQDPARKLIAPGQPSASYLFCKVDPIAPNRVQRRLRKQTTWRLRLRDLAPPRQQETASPCRGAQPQTPSAQPRKLSITSTKQRRREAKTMQPLPSPPHRAQPSLSSAA